MQEVHELEFFVLNGALSDFTELHLYGSKLTRHRLKNGHLDLLTVVSKDILKVTDYLTKLGYFKIFEELWVPLGDELLFDDGLFTDAFELLAEKYDSFGNSKNNIACYNQLIQLALAASGSKNNIKVLDYGCGTGNILETKHLDKLSDVQGYDGCGEMRRKSLLRGLSTLSPTELSELEDATFNIAILNYVYSYVLLTENHVNELDSIARLITPGGVIVGNIHKDIAIDNLVVWGEINKHKHHMNFEPSAYGTVAVIKCNLS